MEFKGVSGHPREEDQSPQHYARRTQKKNTMWRKWGHVAACRARSHDSPWGPPPLDEMPLHVFLATVLAQKLSRPSCSFSSLAPCPFIGCQPSFSSHQLTSSLIGSSSSVFRGLVSDMPHKKAEEKVKRVVSGRRKE